MIEQTDSRDFLRSFLQSKRQEIDPAILATNQGIYRRFGIYEKGLELFLGQPLIGQIGHQMMAVKQEIEQVGFNHLQSQEQRDAQLHIWRVQHQTAEEDLQVLRARINGVGRSRFYHLGDFSLILGRVQVKLCHLQNEGRLSLLGKVATLFIQPRWVHPQIEQRQEVIRSHQERLAQKVSEKEVENSQFAQNRALMGANLARHQEELLEMLDEWASGDLDHLLPHLLYYRRLQAAVIYARGHKLIGDERREFLKDLVKFGLLPREDYALVSDVEKKTEDTVTVKEGGVSEQKADLPLRMIIGGQIFEEQKEAQRAFFQSFGQGLSHSKRRQIFNKLVQSLLYLSLEHKPPDVRVFHKGDRRIEQLGGEARLRVGSHRVILNRVRLEAGELAVEVVDVLHREATGY